MPVATLQKAQARVQISPRIMKVACFLSQHSPMLGQPASSHTVTSLFDFTISRVSRYPFEVGALTRIHSGLRSTSWSGRCAFSGWRTRGRLLTVSRMVTMFVLSRPALFRAAENPQDQDGAGDGDHQIAQKAVEGDAEKPGQRAADEGAGDA